MKTLVVLSFLVLAGCGTQTSQPNTQTSMALFTCKTSYTITSPKTVYIYGDSVSYGYEAYDQNNCPDSWVQQSATSLGMATLNNAVPGTWMESSNQYEQLMTDVWPQDSIVVFSPGINDANKFPTDQTYQAQYEQDLIDVLNKAQLLGVKIYIGGPVHALNPGSNGDPDFNQAIDLYNNLNKQAVQTVGYGTYVDITDFYQPSLQTNADWMHPNFQGDSLISAFFLQNM